MILAAGLALASAFTFALNNAALRRGVVSGTVAQAMVVTVPMGAVVCWLGVFVSGNAQAVGSVQPQGIALLSLAGILHFVGGRYCNYRATKAMGAVLVGPVQQVGIFVTLLLAILLLGEVLTLLQAIGIVLILVAPLLALDIAILRKRLKGVLTHGQVIGASSGHGTGSLQFVPQHKEGYVFAALSALAFGTSPLLISAGIDQQAGLAGGLVASAIAYSAATAVLLFCLLVTSQLGKALSISGDALKWFTVTGIMVTTAQALVYMALAIAPVSVVIPIHRTSIVLRVGIARILNPHLESFDGRVMLATACSLIGAIAISIDPDMLMQLVIAKE